MCDGIWLLICTRPIAHLFFDLPIAVTTPSHGTAFDIVGTGQAKVEAMTNAFRLACRMGLASVLDRKNPPKCDGRHFHRVAKLAKSHDRAWEVCESRRS